MKKKDEDDFTAAMEQAGVKPLSRRQLKVPDPTVGTKDFNIVARRRSASEDNSEATHTGHYEAIEWLGPHDIVEFKRDGIQQAVFKNLKQGRYEIGAILDLHRYRVEEARIALFRFVEECLESDLRCVLVLHGKGGHTPDSNDDLGIASRGKQVSRLKSYTVHWLKAMRSVQAFSSTRQQDGGTGSLYLLLKKSDKSKEANRRHFHADDKFR